MDKSKNHPTPADGNERFSGSPAADAGLVERLVRLADTGPKIPDDGADAIRDAVRPAWRREVRARSRRRVIRVASSLTAAAAAVATVVLLVVLVRTEPEAVEPAGRLLVAVGDIEISPAAGRSFRATSDDAGLEVSTNSLITTGSSAGATIQLAGGQSLRLDEGSELGVASATAFTLASGAVYVDSDGVDGPGVEVRTTFGVAREIGTQFEVRRVADALVVRVRDGKVVLSRDADELIVHRGTALTIAADGSRSFTRVAAFDPVWDWVQRLAPTFEIEGRTAADLLNWVSHETGLWISFESSEVEAAARGAVLHGSLDDIAPSDAAALVLPGCGLEVDRGSGGLTVRFQGDGQPVPSFRPEVTPTG